MDATNLTMSADDTKLIDSPLIVKNKPKKRSLIERELETSLTERITSPIVNIEGNSTSRYGRARRAKADSDFCDTEKAVAKVLKTPVTGKSLPKVQSPVYKMHASNSPVKLETPKRVSPLESNIQNQIDKIHHENVSLSRFGSNENKQSPTKTYGKVYIRKDLIQSKEKEDSEAIIKTFSPNKSTQKSNSHIRNILERSSEKYSLSVSTSKKRPSKEYLDTSSVVKTLDFDSGKKKIKDGKDRTKVMLSKSEIFDIEAKCEYQVGDLGWARIGTYPFWPCIVTREPYTDLFVKKKMFGRIEHDIVHVTFFGDNGRRGWIVDNMLRKYQGILEFQHAKETFTPEAKKKDPRLYSAFFVSEKKLALWNCSVQEAETLLKEPKRLRIDLFNDMLEKSRVKPLKHPSSKMTRTNSDVSLSESLLGTLFSEDDQKHDDLDRSKSRSRKKSFDVSEVVTACLDNMAAKTGMTKIQKQSHMDRWLQKAKSKTPEKSQPKISIKTESKGVSLKKKSLTVRKSQMTFLNKTKKILPANLMSSLHNENDYSSLEISGTKPVTESTKSIGISRNGLGYITKVETLAGKDYDFLNVDNNSLNDEYIIEQVDVARDVVVANTCSTTDAVLYDQLKDYKRTAETLEEFRVPKSAPTNTNLNYVDEVVTKNEKKGKSSRINEYDKDTINNQAVNSVLKEKLKPLVSECLKSEKTVSSQEGAITVKSDSRVMETSPVVSSKKEVSIVNSDKCMMDKLKETNHTVTSLKGTSQPAYVAESINHNHENEFSCTIDITVTELNDEPTDQLAEPTEVNAEPTELNAEPLKLNDELAKLKAEPIDLNADLTELNTEPIELNSQHTNLHVEPTKLNSEPTELNAEPADLNTTPIEINAETKEINADSTELNGEPTELNTENTDVIAERTNLNDHPTEVNSGRTELNAKPNEIILVESNELSGKIANENSEPIKLYSEPEETPDESSHGEKEKRCTSIEIKILDNNAPQQDETKCNDVAMEIDDIKGDSIVYDVKGTKDIVFNNFESKVCSKEVCNISTKNMEVSFNDDQDAPIDGSLANHIDNVNVKEHDKIDSKIACENSHDFSNCDGRYSENGTQILPTKEHITEYTNKLKDIIYNAPVGDISTNSNAKVLVLLDNNNKNSEKQMVPNECKESCILQNMLEEETKIEDAPSSLVVEGFDKNDQIIKKDIFLNNDIQNAHSETDVPSIDKNTNLKNKAIKLPHKITEIDNHENSKKAQNTQKFIDKNTANQSNEVEPMEIHFDVAQKQHKQKTLKLKGSEISTKHLDKRKTRSKTNRHDYENVNKSFKDPNFLHYLELRQDMLVEDNPGLTQEEVVNYLYKTWLYEVSSKLEEVKPKQKSLKSLSDKSSNQKSVEEQTVVANSNNLKPGIATVLEKEHDNDNHMVLLTNDQESLEISHRNKKTDVEILIPNEISEYNKNDTTNGYPEPITQKCIEIKQFECNSESMLIDPEKSELKCTTRSETNKKQGFVTKNKAIENTYFQHSKNTYDIAPSNESVIQKEHENNMVVRTNDQENLATEHGNKKKDIQVQKETEKTVENVTSNGHNEPFTGNCVDNVKREKCKPESLFTESGLKNGKTQWKTNNRQCFVMINKALENTTQNTDFQYFNGHANYFEPSKVAIVKKEFLYNGPSLTNNKETHNTDLQDENRSNKDPEETELLVKSKTSNGHHEPKQNEKCNDDFKQVECNPVIVPIDLDNSVVSEMRKTRSKTRSKQGSATMNNALENPDFQNYVELRQDTVIDEYPHFTREEIVNYLYKTWLYLDSSRFEAEQAEDQFVKGLNKITDENRKCDIKSEVFDFKINDATHVQKENENETIILKNNQLNDQEGSKINQDQNNGVKVMVEINLPVGDSTPIKHHEAKPNEVNIDRQIKSYAKTSINSQNSDTLVHIEKRRKRSKTNSKHHCITLRKALNNSDFQRYLELRHNKLIIENPHLTKKEIINYLYRTWFQDVDSKPEAKKTEQTLITDFTHKLAKRPKKDSKSELTDFESTEIDEIDSTKCLDQFQNDEITITTDLQKGNKCVKVEVDVNEIPAVTNIPKHLKPIVKSPFLNQKDFDTETASINSEDSEICLEKLKPTSKINNRQRSMTKGLDDPEFQHYLELRQDTLIDENPQLTQEEIMHYLHKTWLYEESFKPEANKSEQLLVKGLKQEPALSPKKVKKKNVEKQLVVKLEEIMLKEKPQRKLAKPLYNYDYSDIEEELETFEILNASKDHIKIKTKTSSDLSHNLKSIQKNEKDKEKEEYKELAEIYDDEYDIEEQYFEYLTIPKPNLFKGLVREKICNICEKKTNLVKCKGCNDMFHIECVNKPIEVTEVPMASKGRKKKMKPKSRRPKGLNDSNSLDSESQSDDKSQEINVSGEVNMSIEEIELEPILTVDLDVFESHSTTKMHDLLGGNDVNYTNSYSGINWDGSVPGKCEIVDVKPKIKLEVDPAFTNFRCHDCQKYEVPVCFVCKSAESPKGKVEYRQKCQQQHCNKFYHLECLDHWPQTQLNSLEPVKDHKFESFTCARHVCHTCVCDDPRGCKTRFSSDKLARCVRCPATYHCFTKCLPAGSQILTGSHIVCPRHYEHRPGKVPCHVNTGWCFICALGGTLICCEYCPTSFHAECLNIKPPEGNYMCEDCETGRLPLYGEMVWVKLGHYRWWPGIILHPSEIPKNIMAVKHSPGEFVVRFFGQYDYYWVNRGRVFPFQEGDSGRISTHKSKIDEAFIKAMAHAQRACEILKNVEPNEEESQELAQSLLPPQYVKLKCNKPCGSLVGWRTDDEHSLTQCECDPREEDVCGPYTNCLNRMLLTECGPTCRAGDKCNNRQFEKRQYPKLVPYRTPHRGWGLKTLEDIRQGQFVIEYVGELIDEEEFQRRMRWMHEIRDENFYFLTLDKERMIDAGPKGNLARFMNHCCEPNCETQKWTVLGDVRVGLFAMKDIPANSELTFNYNLESAGIEKKQCLCGASRCSGYIGAKPKLDEAQLKKKKSYKKRKQPDESPSTSKSKPKPRMTSRSKPKELTEIEKDLLIIKSAVNGLPSDSECDRSVDTERKTLKRKRTDTPEENSYSGVLKKVKIELTECVK